MKSQHFMQRKVSSCLILNALQGKHLQRSWYFVFIYLVVIPYMFGQQTINTYLEPGSI